MIVSLSWLQQWLGAELKPESLCDALTFTGLEVEACEATGVEPANMVVGEVLSCEQHPQADSLSLCQVDSGSARLQIVCGAHNVRAGLKVALALPGARIEGRKLKKSKLRGVESQGMMCSKRELGLGSDHSGIIELAAEAKVGESLERWLPLRDYLIDINITPNRGDCLSIQGIARDLAASQPDWPLQPPLSLAAPKPQHDQRLPVQLSAASACPKFCGCVITGVDLSRPSPAWLTERLEQSGVRSIDPAVDITNYVMLELGQPMHAYDLRSIAGGIEVRYARAGERLVMLDNSEQELHDDTLLITDAEKVLALGGVMGGKHSGVQADTRDIFLEAAWFNPEAVHGQARARALSSEAAYRFERGVDSSFTEQAMWRATQLFADITGGSVGAIVTTQHLEQLPTIPTIELDLARVQSLLGLSIDNSNLRSDRLLGYLESLGCSVEVGALWRVQPPAYRPDLRAEEDLLEEIVRIHGYHRLPESLPPSGQQLNPNPQPSVAPEVVRMAQLGFQENINFSFVSAAQEEATRPPWAGASARLLKPAGDDMSTMRSSMLPGLLNSLQSNLVRQRRQLKFFECGRVFWLDEAGGFVERDHLAGASVVDELFWDDWQGKALEYGFYDLKAEIQQLARLECRPWRQPPQFLHPGKSASVVDASGAEVGYCGLLHPDTQRLFELGAAGSVWVFELQRSALSPERQSSYQELSAQPEIHRDLGLLVPQDVDYRSVIEQLRAAAGPNLKFARAFDLYRGDQVQEQYYSLALRLGWQHPGKSLSSESVDKLMAKIIASLVGLGIKLRA